MCTSTGRVLVHAHVEIGTFVIFSFSSFIDRKRTISFVLKIAINFLFIPFVFSLNDCSLNSFVQKNRFFSSSIDKV